MESGLTKNQIISALSKSPHGKLMEYVPIGKQATIEHPEFMAHLIAWDRQKGQVRDAKVALPIVSLSVPFDEELAENSLAHLGLLGPREILKAFRFAMELRPHGKMRGIRRIIESYLRERESNFPQWERTALQHRAVLKELYALAHVKPAPKADEALFKGKYREGGLFDLVSRLKDMSAVEAAGTIIERKIPFLVAAGALGKKSGDPDLVLALIGRMTPTELITNTKMLERLGVKKNPALRGAYDKALEGASKSKANILKTTRAAEEMDDEDLREKLRGVQEKQIQSFSGVEGNWLVLGDRSPSMNLAVELAKQVAGTLAKMVKGKVWLVFFDSVPHTVDVTGLPLDIIAKATRHITAGGGGTSIGCGLLRMFEAKEEIDGIAIISDAQENTPPLFAQTYKAYSVSVGKEVPVYLYRCQPGSRGYSDVDLAYSMKAAGLDLQEFDLRSSSADYYSLPNLVSTMRTNRYSLIDEIMASKLLKLSDVFKFKGKEKTIAQSV